MVQIGDCQKNSAGFIFVYDLCILDGIASDVCSPFCGSLAVLSFRLLGCFFHLHDVIIGDAICSDQHIDRGADQMDAGNGVRLTGTDDRQQVKGNPYFAGSEQLNPFELIKTGD